MVWSHSLVGGPGGHTTNLFSFSTDRDEIEEHYEGKLKQEMSGTLYEVFSRVMRVLVGKKITVPGSFKTYVTVL